MDRFGIIQLSDIQFGKKHTFGFPSNIARSLIFDIRAQAAKYNFTTLYLIVSGDISETGHADEFKDAKREIETIAKDLGIDSVAVLFVAGNHDVSWPASRIESEIGDSSLRFTNLNKFITQVTGRKEQVLDGKYPLITDARFGAQFLLLNSCESETHENHIGSVDKDKLLTSLSGGDFDPANPDGYLRICVLHHRLDTTISDVRAAISNASDIESILRHHKFDVVLTGHVHEGTVHVVEKDGLRMLYSGCGSTGVNKLERLDGVPNQYSIHVLDRKLKRFESHFRAYSPTKHTQIGIGGWIGDASYSEEQGAFSLPLLKDYTAQSHDFIQDGNLVARLGIVANPFVYSNAEKIDRKVLMQLFVSDEARHKEAKRLTGDAIIRGPRGAGKTMLLRFLDIYGNMQFGESISKRETAECFPVFVNFSLLHTSDLGEDIDAVYKAADRLIYDSVVAALTASVVEVRSASFTQAVSRVKVRLDSLKNTPGTGISKIGAAIREYLSGYFKHVLLLIDEVGQVFPKYFFSDKQRGFLAWMNSIRNSGPFYTRVAVYPTDVSDILNEERFGAIINLGFDVKSDLDFSLFRNYVTDLINKYLAPVSWKQSNRATISDLLVRPTNGDEDPLEQLIYASDGSVRRLMSFMDKCVSRVAGSVAAGKGEPLDKADVLEMISEYANNLISGYPISEREFAESIIKVCKREATFRFREENLLQALKPLYLAREELNMIRMSEPAMGKKPAVYEFVYPVCIYYQLQTHQLIDTERLCQDRSRVSGEWIKKTVLIKRENLEALRTKVRTAGEVTQIDGSIMAIVAENGLMFVGESKGEIHVGDKVSFFVNDTIAVEIVLISSADGRLHGPTQKV